MTAATNAAGFRIDYLARHPEHVGTLADLHVAEWRSILPDWTYAEAFAELASHAVGPVIPTTFVALADDGALLGSCSLLENDHEEIREYSPWLASLYVLEEQRGRGVGSALTRRVVAEAAALGVAKLYLYVRDAQRFYESLGWRVCARYAFGELEVDVMSIEPRADSTASVVVPANTTPAGPANTTSVIPAKAGIGSD